MNPLTPPIIYTGAGLPAEEEFARDIVHTLKPGLRTILAVLRDKSEGWAVPDNGIDAKIAAAYVQGEPLAGYSDRTWDEWGQTFAAIMTMINTPVTITYRDNTTTQKTPAQVLATRDERID